MVLRRISVVITAFALTTATLQIGCTRRPSLPEISAETYYGPGLALDSASAEYVAVIQAPTPGWVVGLDRVAEQYQHYAVFITLRRPNPGYLYPQMIVEQRVATTVATTGPIKVYARILDPDARASKISYVLAAQSEGTQKRR